MRAISLEYHDVVPRGRVDSSGFPGVGAASYKLGPDDFERHLLAIKVTRRRPESVLEFAYGDKSGFPLFLTFDDGGTGAFTYTADTLSEFGYCGHFMITVDHIGQSSFLAENQIRHLRQRGHVIGTHSCSHPRRMSHCSWEQLIEEWSRSVEILSNILGERVVVASMPGGYYSRKVAQAASCAGIKVLFTPEPTTRCTYVEDCLVLGRYSIRAWTSAETVQAIARGKVGPRVRQFLFWNSKKIPKALGDEMYEKIRQYFLSMAK